MTDAMARKIADTYGTPVYVYDKSIIEKRYSLLAEALPAGAGIFYSMKANPSLAICQLLRRLTKRIEVSSLGELYCAKRAGFANGDILLSGPAKSPEFLREGVAGHMMIQAESLAEIKSLERICCQESCQARMSIRLNPDFGLSHKGIVMTGVSSQFGLETGDFGKAVERIRRSTRIHLKGISVYTGTQILKADDILSVTREILQLVLFLQQRYDLNLELADFGGGFGVPYYGEEKLDMQRLRAGLSTLFNEYAERLNGVQFCFESGRYLTAESGWFLTRILYSKESKGKKYLVCDGGFNAACIASYFTREIRGNFPLRLISQGERTPACGEAAYTITGPLCSPRDILGAHARLPCAREGDYICIGNVGAYGLTFSPVLFIGHPIPPEVLIEEGGFRLIRERGDAGDLLRRQIGLTQEGKA